jgi:hypothetical protein
MTKPATPRARIGCGFLCVSALLTCILLGINGLIVMNLVNAVGPLLLLVIEWWVCDVTIDWLRPLRREK